MYQISATTTQPKVKRYLTLAWDIFCFWIHPLSTLRISELQHLCSTQLGISGPENWPHKLFEFTYNTHTHTAHLLRDRSTSSFFQRRVGFGSPWTWHLNSTLSSTRTTWFTGRCTNNGLSESGQNIFHWFWCAFEACSKPWENCVFFIILFYSSATHQTQRAELFRSLSPRPCWQPRTRRFPCLSSLCLRSSAFLHEPAPDCTELEWAPSP